MTNIKIGDEIKAFAKHDHPGKGHRDNPFVVTRVSGKGRSFIVHAGAIHLSAK